MELGIAGALSKLTDFKGDGGRGNGFRCGAKGGDSNLGDGLRRSALFVVTAAFESILGTAGVELMATPLCKTGLGVDLGREDFVVVVNGELAWKKVAALFVSFGFSSTEAEAAETADCASSAWKNLEGAALPK